jgi:hypothetical protein
VIDLSSLQRRKLVLARIKARKMAGLGMKMMRTTMTTGCDPSLKSNEAAALGLEHAP